MTIQDKGIFTCSDTNKSKTNDKLKEYKIEVKNQLGRPIRSLNSDRRVEFKTCDDFCKAHGIRHIYPIHIY